MSRTWIADNMEHTMAKVMRFAFAVVTVPGPLQAEERLDTRRSLSKVQRHTALRAEFSGLIRERRHVQCVILGIARRA